MAKKQRSKTKDHLNLITDAEQKKIKLFGQNIKNERNRRGWTLEHVEALGYKSWKHWQDIEAGNRNVNLTTILRIAKILKISAGELLKEV